MTPEWKSEPLGKICRFERGLTYAKGDQVDASENIVLRANNIDLTTNCLDLTELRYLRDSFLVPHNKKLKRNSILICTASGSRDHLGKVAYIDDDYGYAFGGFMGLLTPVNGILPKYLFHLMTSEQYRRFINDLSDGVNINNLRFDDLARFPVPHPASQEQKRIVDILDKAFAAIATAKANTEKNLQNVRAVFENRLEEVFRLGGKRIKTSTLGEACTISSALVDPRDRSYRQLPHVGAANIQSRTGRLSILLSAEEEGIKSGKFTFDASTVLYGKIRPNLMKVARPNFPGLCSADIYPLSPNPTELNRDYLFYLLLSPNFTRYAIAGSARAGIPKVNRDHLFAYRCQVPPIPQQREISAELDSLSLQCDRLEHTYIKKTQTLTELKSSLLQEAFNGHL